MKRIAALLLCATSALAAPELLPQRVIEERLARAIRGNDARHEELVRLFREAGCEPQEQNVAASKLPNVICTIPGTTRRTILITAHYDMTGPGLGVGDNWGSASLLPSLFQAFVNEHPRQTLVFIGFTDEERGLVGARHYLRTAKHLDDIDAMINMDGVGMASTRIWSTKSSMFLLSRLRRHARALQIDLTESSLDGSGVMDSFPFHARGIPVLSLHGLATGNYDVPHSARDDRDAVDPRHLYDTYRLVARMVEELTQPTARTP
jgi:Iap family predicted aminopeptidase